MYDFSPGRFTRYVTFVVKVSKLCNLRCAYCYEMAELNNPAQMSRENVRTMYRHISEYYLRRDSAEGERTCIEFNWHGGEPLLVKPQWYWDTLADQREIFKPDQLIENTMQSNLTVLDDERIRLIRDGFRGNVGVSIDVFGGLRVDVAGRPRQATTEQNLARLNAAGVHPGRLAVLHGKNIHRVDEIFHTFQKMGTGFRVLPLFAGGLPGQHDGHGVTSEQIAQAWCRLVDLWLTTPKPVQVVPIVEMIQAAILHLTGNRPFYYDKREYVPVWLVNTDGQIYTDGDPYGSLPHSTGNIFRQGMDEMLAGDAFQRSVHEAERRMAANCVHCPFLGACSGYDIAESSNNDFTKTEDGVRRCHVERVTLQHIVKRLTELDVLNRVRQQLAKGGAASPEGIQAPSVRPPVQASA